LRLVYGGNRYSEDLDFNGPDDVAALEALVHRNPRQSRYGLTHNLGGMPYMNICSVAIVGRYGD